MEPTGASHDGGMFDKGWRRITLPGAELVEHSSKAVVASRVADRCHRDGHDEICLDTMISCATASMERNGQRRVGRGSLCILDFAGSLNVHRSRHQTIGVILSRQRLLQVLRGEEIDRLAGRRLAASGLTTLLQSHLRTTFDEVPRLSPAECGVAASVAVDLALAVLQGEARSMVEVEQSEEGYYRAARQVIEQKCNDPDLNPLTVARLLGCSRASLYRAFAHHGESVAAVIWATRLERARRMLASDCERRVSVSDIAMRSGFVEQPSFNRMFKRRFGITPRDARLAGQGFN